ncbi:unnamed protein product [Rotaria socialis]|uniref:Endonuclease/exonuclease/phosphatase domain-containing protein n=1 Tax=Rotaria socialis TaxID=392032 RepID=A0A817Y3C5_9BILA|nr:unnamed protein product [Rotaria socialis]CAF4401688.1 unnamed protein product [Rotaria socialis]
MTFNIASCHGSDRGIADVAFAIEQEQPDLVALQEVDKFTRRSGRLIDQAAQLANLSHLSHSFFIHSMNFDDGQYGNAILSRFSFENVKLEHHLDGQNRGETRSIGIISVKTSNEYRLFFGVMHLESEIENLRIAQVRQAIELYRKIVPDDQPFILAGDFNDSPTSQTLNLLLTEGRLLLPCTECPTTYPADHPNQTLDYILMNTKASATFKLNNYRVSNIKKASDHCPLIMELRSSSSLFSIFNL